MIRGCSKASTWVRQYANHFIGDVYRKHCLYFLKMSVIGHDGITAGKISGNDMRLIGEVVNGELCPVEQAFLPCQQSGKFKFVGEKLRKGDSRDCTSIFPAKRFTAEAVYFLNSVEGNRSIHFMRINEIKEFLYRRVSAGLGLRVFAEKVYGKNGGIQSIFSMGEFFHQLFRMLRDVGNDMRKGDGKNGEPLVIQKMSAFGPRFPNGFDNVEPFELI